MNILKKIILFIVLSFFLTITLTHNLIKLNAVEEVEDSTKPSIVFKNKKIVLYDNTVLNNTIFKSYINYVLDDKDDLTIEDVVVDYSRVRLKEGNYIVVYRIRDLEENYTSYSINVTVKKHVMSTIKTNDILLYKNEDLSKERILKNIHFNTLNDDEIIQNLEVDLSKVNIFVAGEYEARVFGIISEEEKVDVNIKVIVMDNLVDKNDFDVFKYIPFLAIFFIFSLYIIQTRLRNKIKINDYKKGGHFK